MQWLRFTEYISLKSLKILLYYFSKDSNFTVLKIVPKKNSINLILIINKIRFFAPVAQRIERWIPDPKAAGSPPAWRTMAIKLMGKFCQNFA